MTRGCVPGWWGQLVSGGKTEVSFAQVGLADQECFEACASAWRTYINGSLRNLITAARASVWLKLSSLSGGVSFPRQPFRVDCGLRVRALGPDGSAALTTRPPNA